ncbi:hypothetical protein [Bacillus sp. REN16]|uniref:hypothetical protein n=1 Tax=Bacillus sp. REN16 TaxID=2887296 RepID=UPI001E44A6C9|nr:hypothetical protein [Bacillus sp. REN16]MCC3359205.1 hypothetical protein [Bacillus sp. REN16]
MNFTLLFKVNQLEEQAGYISGLQQDISYRVENQASVVYNALEEFKNEQSWISTISMQIDNKKIKDGEAIATFNWQVKELQNNSMVEFHYSFGGDGEVYTSLPAEEVQNGLFQVMLPFEFEKEPQWRIGQITSDSYYSEEVSEKEAIEGLQNTINFYVTISHDDLVKSSEIQQEFLEDLRSSFYGSIQTDVHLFNSKLDITLINYLVDDKSMYVEKAILLKYKGNTLIGEEELQGIEENGSENMERFFHLNQVDKYEDIRLVMKVIYSNGETFEKEIYQ